MLTETRVKAVEKNHIQIFEKRAKKESAIPYGLCVWSTGITQKPILKKFIDQIERQSHKIALTVDPFMKVHGTSNVFALGDCAQVVYPKLTEKIDQLFKECDENHDGTLQIDEVEHMFLKLSDVYPQLKVYAKKITSLFQKVDLNRDGSKSTR